MPETNVVNEETIGTAVEAVTDSGIGKGTCFAVGMAAGAGLLVVANMAVKIFKKMREAEVEQEEPVEVTVNPTDSEDEEN